MIAGTIVMTDADFSEWKKKKSSGVVLTSLHLGSVELFITEKEGVKYAVLIGSQCCAICPVPATSPSQAFDPTSPEPIGATSLGPVHDARVYHAPIPMKEIPPQPDDSVQRLFQPR